jgi:WD40 repeat protein
MSQTTKASFLIETRGTSRDLGAFVVAARFSGDGTTVAFALGDGTVRLVSVTDPGAWTTVQAHDGAILSLAPDPASPSGFITGGDDGTLRRIDPVGAVSTIASHGMRWVEHVATHALSKGKGLIAASVGKIVHLFDEAGHGLKAWTHPSTVTGIAFDGKGKRVAASHYNGASIWYVAARTDTPRKLDWKGSHVGVAFHPEGEAVVTAMQENALHGWRLSDGQHMRMSGYPAKSQSLSFTRKGRWLASSGAEAMVLWPFHGGGPMGKAPLELAGGDGILCQQVAAHPMLDLLAGGFADGLVVIADVDSSRIVPIAPPGHGPVSALCWNASGGCLALGTETGFAAIVDLGTR